MLYYSFLYYMYFPSIKSKYVAPFDIISVIFPEKTLYYMLSIIKLDVGLTILLNGEWEDYGDVVSSFYKYGVRV